ncbi:MAG: L-histidine N(alpha)-methyltransferase [Acidobacteriaceae bacterium]|nr:L-histidine N(alpha)-methyltransferase [Acidobacteriaceae bacterium]
MPIVEAPNSLREAVREAAIAGLSSSPKTLPPWLFYDEAGSKLFDEITELPEYYLTRTERELFKQLAPQLYRYFSGPVTVAELGAGSAGKTGVLLSELASRQRGLLYQPIDVSASALEDAAAALTRFIPGLQVQPQVANYITENYEIERPAGSEVFALYIGSSIGNFDPAEQRAILQKLREHLLPGDTLLLGVDLAPSAGKCVNALLKAYNDAAGVTAAFNKNVLVRLNRELDADFDLEGFAHEARWNAERSRIEMHLISLAPQVVHVEGERFVFAKGETIHTENSYKFTDASLEALLTDVGFAKSETVLDAHGCYAVAMARAV